MATDRSGSTSGKIKVGLIFGGKSAEHEVSCESARHVAEAMDPSRYQVIPLGINKQGSWVLSEAAKRALEGQPLVIPERAFQAEGRSLAFLTNEDPWPVALVDSDPPTPLLDFDVMFPMLHGPHGEDGSVQGLLELAGYPYVGSAVLGSALGMDKEKMKVAFAASGLPVAPYFVFGAHQWAGESDQLTKKAAELGFPSFTKPANMGSSVGISKCVDHASLRAGVELALQYDGKVVVEEGIQGREIECAVLGNEMPEASVCGEVLPGRDFYDYEAKYLDERSRTVIPASIPGPVAQIIQSYAVRAFRAVGAAGMARVDFFYEEGARGVLINEINTIPGFTTISMFPKLWEASGLSFSKLVDRLIDLACQRYKTTPGVSEPKDGPPGRSVFL